MAFLREHYQHRLDVESLLNLRAIRWFESVSKYLVAEDLETDFYLLNLADNVLLTGKDFPALHAMLERACGVLGVAPVPKLFLDTSPSPHCLSIGEKRTMVIITSGLLDLLEEDELAAAIAHEAGHLACGHSYYQLLAENFSGLAQVAGMVPGLAVASFGVKIPLFDWYRKADLSADRAAFLVLRDAAPVVRMIGKVAGGSRAIAARIPAASLIEQAGEIEKVTGELKTGGLKKKASYLFSNLVMQGMLRKQPWPSVRIKEIEEWSRSPLAIDLLQGKLPEPRQAEEAQQEDQRGFLRRWSDAVTATGKSMLFWGTGEKPPEGDGEPAVPDADDSR